MLEIILAKFEVILASETPSFIPVLVQMYFFLTFKRCSSPDFVHVCSDRSIKDADKVEGQKYAYYQSFGGPENHVLHLKSYGKPS